MSLIEPPKAHHDFDRTVLTGQVRHLNNSPSAYADGMYHLARLGRNGLEPLTRALKVRCSTH